MLDEVAELFVFHGAEYGGAEISAAIATPSTINVTPMTPTSSEALAATVTLPATFSLAPGVAIETEGGVTSGGVAVAVNVTLETDAPATDTVCDAGWNVNPDLLGVTV